MDNLERITYFVNQEILKEIELTEYFNWEGDSLH